VVQELHAALVPPSRGVVARLLITARRAGDRVAATESVVIFSRGERSVVSSPAHAARDLSLLGDGERAASPADPGEDTRTPDYRALPLVWRNGSAAVLMHEAAGHAAEHRAEPIEWPAWLSVRDEPASPHDDTGGETRVVDLLRGEMPSSARCASFSAVPLRRMSNVVVRQDDAPFTLPHERIEIELVGGGSYDPLSDSVRLVIVRASHVSGETKSSLAPFVIEESRSSVAFALRGAAGEPERYPGVVCSSEGQELTVGSHAPIIVTEF
jgi:predicted Zn-dependent protease